MSYMRDNSGRRLDGFEVLGMAQRSAIPPGTVVASNCFGTSYDGATKQAALQTGVTGTSRIPHVIGTDCGEIRFVYTNWYTDRLATSATVTSSATFADIDGPSAITLSATLETSGTGAAGFRVTFGGRTSVTIDPGGTVISDPVSIDLAAGATIYSRTYISSGNWYPNKRTLDSSTGAGGFLSTTDATTPWYTGGSPTSVPDASGSQFGPSAILGLARATYPAVLVVGDSIGNGYGDAISGANDFVGANTAQTYRQGGGFITRALVGHAGMVNVAVGGDFARKFSGEQPHVGYARRQGMGRFCNVAICEYGRNDVSNPSTLSACQGYLITIWTRMKRRGLETWQTTITPRTTSTDSWQTTANQTVHSSETVRTQLNDWIRDGAPLTSASNLTAVATGTTGALRAGDVGHPLTGYFDAADLAESARNSGKWAAPYLSLSDANISSSSNNLTSATANFTSARDLGSSVILPMGSAGALVVCSIQSVNSTTSVTLTTSATTAITNGVARLGVMTTDGIHPTVGGHKIIAPSIDYTRLLAN